MSEFVIGNSRGARDMEREWLEQCSQAVSLLNLQGPYLTTSRSSLVKSAAYQDGRGPHDSRKLDTSTAHLSRQRSWQQHDRPGTVHQAPNYKTPANI